MELQADNPWEDDFIPAQPMPPGLEPVILPPPPQPIILPPPPPQRREPPVQPAQPAPPPQPRVPPRGPEGVNAALPLALPGPQGMANAALPGMLSGLPTFDGEDSAPGQFFRQLETVGELAGLTPDQLALTVHLKLKGAAARYVQNTPALVRSRDYAGLKGSIMARFTQRENEGAAEKRFTACTQRAGERAAEFCDRLKEMGNSLLRSVLSSRDLTDQEEQVEREAHRTRVLRRFVSGLRPELGRQVARSRPADLSAALQLAMTEEELHGGAGASGGLGLCSADDLKNLVSMITSEVANKLSTANPMQQQEASHSQAPQAADSYTAPLSTAATAGTAHSSQAELPQLCAMMKRMLEHIKDIVPAEAKCFTCGEKGHFSRHCPLFNPQPVAPGVDDVTWRTECSSCGSRYHWAQDCGRNGQPMGNQGRGIPRGGPRGRGRGPGRGGPCWRCHAPGHFARECPAPAPAAGPQHPNGPGPQAAPATPSSGADV